MGRSQVLEERGRDALMEDMLRDYREADAAAAEGGCILLALWRRGLLRRIDREKLRQFLGLSADPLALSRRYPMWRVLARSRSRAHRRAPVT